MTDTTSPYSSADEEEFLGATEVHGCDEEARIVLDAKGVTKRYHLEGIDVEALRGVDLEICEGEMLAIMGPSGSGKSTLMHIVGLLDHPTEGVVRVEGIDVSNMEPNQLAAVRNKRIGFVFQSFNLLARTTATANVELPLIYAGIPASRRTAIARQALERVVVQQVGDGGVDQRQQEHDPDAGKCQVRQALEGKCDR